MVLKKRLLTALLGIPLVLGVVWYGNWPYLIAGGILIGLSVDEWSRMAILFRAEKTRILLLGLLGTVYITTALIALILLRMHFDDGLWWTLALLLGVWASDTCAFLAGKAIGGPKLCPDISPNKTWAGVGGGIAGSALTVACLAAFAPLPLGWVEGAVLGAFLTPVGQVGDLLISYAKRKSGLKDTGTILPGHGGLLDRIDALLLCTVFMTAWVLLN